MRLGRPIVSATALALCCVAGLFAATRGVASSHPAMAGGQAKTTITVVMTEFKFKLSKTKNVPVGTVVFKLINRGKIPHDFQINGKKSKLIKPGKTGTLTVVFKKKAAFAYKCTVAGHAQLGMKGALGVGTAKVPTTTTTATTPSTTTTTTTTGAACASPTSSTVSVSMIEYAFHLSTMSVHCGTVTFQVKNDGSAAHDFVFPGIQNAATLLVAPGGSTTLIVNFTNAGSFTYICDVPGHDRLGMVGTLTVTP
jgi:uncharacterized cupredoxin-like copper-binding protein